MSHDVKINRYCPHDNFCYYVAFCVTCEWQSGRHYEYEDTAYTDAEREANRHLHDARQAAKEEGE